MSKYEDALDTLVKIILYEEDNYYENLIANYPEECELLKEAIDKAKKYDQKMKPEKVITKITNFMETGVERKIYTCPSCNTCLNHDGKKFKHCPECGQCLELKR